MFAHVTNLRYWKSERADITTCEDASRADTQRGLFCVADGAGTTLFSNIWAEILVEHFVHDPLVGIDPFEMEWWIRQAQKRYRDLAPQADKLNWNARQKAVEQGAYSTLATLRFIRSDEQTATAELLVVGDSCVIIGQHQQEKITAFPLQYPADFDRAPYCVPALLKNLNRKTLYAKILEITLAPGDCIILATDAVARWIISGGESGQTNRAWHAFQEVANKQTDRDWRAFIDNCRTNQSIVDDDSTALIIHLLASGQDDERLGNSALSPRATSELRKAEFEQARAADNKELIAILYGDGSMLQNTGIVLDDSEKEHARAVADAMREVLQGMREAVKATNFAAKIEPIWWQYADLLMDEPCAETIRKTLASQGVHPKQANAQSQQAQHLPQKRPPFAQSSPQASFSAYPTAQPSISEQTDEPIRAFIGNDPEPARILSPLFFSPDAPAALRAFRAALTTHDDATIVKAFEATFEHELSKEELLSLDNARHRLKFQLLERLRLAIDRDNDDEILAIHQAINATVVSITLSELESKRIRQATEHKAAIERLLHMLEEGTPYQKVDAFRAINPDQISLSANDQFQLDIAHQLVEALNANHDYQICTAYDALEFSPLRKHFSFTQEDQQRIQAARSTRAAIQQLRTLLQNDKKSVALLVDTYQLIRSPQSFLTHEELRVIEAAQAFTRSNLDEQQTIQIKGNTRVHFYDQLFFSPYHFAFSANESEQIERERELLHIARPPIAQINHNTIDSTQFLALYAIKPLYAAMQISILQQRLAAEHLEARQKQHKEHITYWRQQTTPFSLPTTILEDLLHQTLIEQGISEIADKSKRSLEKDIQKMQDEFFKEIRALLIREESAFIIPLSEQQRRNALLPYAQNYVLAQYLQATTPGQTLESWLNKRRRSVTILYYQYPEAHAPGSRDRQESWLFRWWFLRQHSTVSQQGEIEHA